LGGITHRLANLALDDLTKAATEAVNGDLDGAFVHAEPGGGLGLGNVLGVAAEPGLERFKLVRLSGSRVFLSQRSEGAVQQRQGPFAVELAVGTRRIRVGQLQAGRRVSPRLERFHGLAGAAFQAMGVVAHIGLKMLHRAEQKGAEPAPLRVHGRDALPGEQAGEKFLREVAGGVFVRRGAPDKREDRRVIGSA